MPWQLDPPRRVAGIAADDFEETRVTLRRPERDRPAEPLIRGGREVLQAAHDPTPSRAARHGSPSWAIQGSARFARRIASCQINGSSRDAIRSAASLHAC